MLKWLFGDKKQETLDRLEREAAAAARSKREAAAKLEQESKIQTDLSNSFENRLSVRIGYTNYEGGNSDRVIDVLGLGHGYVDAYCHKRKEIRVFRTDRIEWTKLTEKPFYPPSGRAHTGAGRPHRLL